MQSQAKERLVIVTFHKNGKLFLLSSLMTAAVCLRCTELQKFCIASFGSPNQPLVLLWPAKSSCGPVVASPAVRICVRWSHMQPVCLQVCSWPSRR